jgi:hypothetical protein
MKRALLAAVAVVATIALLSPLGATADHRPGHKDTAPNPDLTINADPDPVRFGKSTTISGRLRGQDNASKTIELEANPYPFDGSGNQFKSAGTTTTDANGDYSFTVTPELNTIYHVRAQIDPEQVSADEFVGVRVRVFRAVSDRTPSRGETVTFSGKVFPDHDGDTVFIQRRRPSGTWKTMATTTLQDVAGKDESSYSHDIEISRDGVWRARVKRDEDHLGNKSRRVRIDVQ